MLGLSFKYLGGCLSARQAKHGKPPVLYLTRNQRKQEKTIQVSEDFSDLENKFASINSAIYTTYSFQDDLEHRNDDGFANVNDSMELNNERVIILNNISLSTFRDGLSIHPSVH